MIFLLKCRRLQVIPHFLINRTNRILQAYCNKSEQTKETVRRHVDELNRALLNIEIGMCCGEITHDEKLLRNLSERSTAHQLSTQNQNKVNYNQTLLKENKRLDKKLKNVIAEQGILNDIKYDDSCLKNLTSVAIPNDVATLLSLGPKFAMPPENIPIDDMITDIECIISKHSIEPTKKIARGQVGHTLAIAVNRPQKENRITRFLHTAAKPTNQFLKDNPNIIVSNSDKGSVTIISERDDYKEKMERLLQSDEYEPLDQDVTKIRATPKQLSGG